MELKIGSQDLARALGRSQGIVERKSTMPILSHVLLEARKGNELHVSATDLDLSVSSSTLRGGQGGRLAVSAKHLYEIVRSLPEQAVTLQAGRQRLPRGARAAPPSSASSACRPRTSRRCPRFEKVAFVDVDAEVAARPDRADLFAASNDETRYNLERRLLRAAGAVLRLVATDGHRLALSERPWPATSA